MDYRSVIESAYNRENWEKLLYDIFGNRAEFWRIMPTVPHIDQNIARYASQLGKITLPDGYIIAVYEVELTNKVQIERNRSSIRNLLSSHWRNQGCAGAFMFCFRKNEAVLRFSYISQIWTFNEDGKYTKLETEPRRFTYLLGAGHRSRTAIDQFKKLKDSSLRLADITKAFSVEALGKMFFDGYKKQYEDIILYITGKQMVKVNGKWEEKALQKPCKIIMDEFSKFEDPEKAVRDYVKKLMGRLVFLQFLQKKGWMGVNQKWGDGDQEFLQNLFVQSSYKSTFVDDVLEPLFDAINTDRSNNNDLICDNRISSGKKIRIPYLNGGLFERGADDDTQFPLPSSYIESLLDFFARYNFTIDENDPNDAEVGVDAEMLGRIFENLLEDNKDKGAFYTPKEIVQYMCRESLIAYLQTKTSIDKLIIQEFVNTHRLPLALPIEKRTPLLDALKKVKICDPAIGSGAFPMGLLNELLECREAFSQENVRSRFEIKREIIQNNIFGVDIEKGAVDIARLRFWLSLIVDSETPEALPNMDFKIIQGNSLITTFNGQYVKLDKANNKQFREEIRRHQDQLKRLQKDYFTAEGNRKHRIIVEIKNELLSIIAEQVGLEVRDWANKHSTFDNPLATRPMSELIEIADISEQRKQIIRDGAALRKLLTDESVSVYDRAKIDVKFFDWNIIFAEIFENYEGFDIVIGNPPYINVQLMSESEKQIFRQTYSTFFKRCDMFCLFLELGLLKLSSSKGIVTLIIPSVVHSNMSYQKIRDLILNRQWLQEVHYTGGDVFNAPTVDTTILVCNKGGNSQITLTNAIDFAYPKSHQVSADYFGRYNNVISLGDDQGSGIFDKLFNPKFDIVDQHYNVFQGIVTGNNPAFIFEDESEALAKGIERELLHPLCHGRDIEKYMVRSRDRRILYIDGSIDIEDYPNAMEWLLNFKNALDKRNEGKRDVISWCSLHRPRVKSELDLKEKILVQNTRNEALKIRMAATLDDTGIYGTQGLNFIIPKDDKADLRYLLGILNSKLINYLFATKFLNLAIKAEYLKQIRIPKVSEKQRALLENIVNQVLIGKQNGTDTANLEDSIDLIVYKLYGLTYDEIIVVDPKTPITREEYKSK